MAEEELQENLEKTEEPTPRRREEARKQGQFARSKSLIPATTLVAIVVALRFAGGQLMERLGQCIVGFFSAAASVKPLTTAEVSTLSMQAGLLIVPVLLLFFAAVVISGLASGFLQSGFVLASEPLQLNFARINPVSGFGRLFSIDSVVELIKALVFIAGLGCLGGAYIYSDFPALASLTNLKVEDILAYASHDGAVFSTCIATLMGACAGLDYLFQRWRTDQQLRMSRQEIKQEMREQEGDPLLKAQLKAIRQKLARRRMMRDVAKADVVITNPTELAVALQYRAGEMSAPRVVGKGADFIAQKIREVARENAIPIVENKPLARVLYTQVEIGRQIPEALYRAVAEVLAYVYRLRRGAPLKAETDSGRSNRVSR